ncbi:MAG: hypothetical protein WC677_03870 [Clostridia bacterium]|jgi:superfamily II DNA/RNA helicase
MQFKELNIIPSILKALENKNYVLPVLVQKNLSKTKFRKAVKLYFEN